MSERTELEELRKANAAMNRQLTSGVYPMLYFEPGRPPTPGMAAGSEVQQPEVRLYNQHGNGNAYSVYPNGLSFYRSPGYVQCVYHNGVQYTPFLEAQHFSRPDSMMYAYPYGVSCPPQEAATRQVDKVLT